jgi:catechol 2,3-dioxygenase-like lactoylglutathione lyase family enzyme
MKALWIPFVVTDLDASVRFYTEHLGLSVVDGWDRAGERGVVLRAAAGAFIELVSPGDAGEVPLAFELASVAEVDRSFSDWTSPAAILAPRRYARGHYGFEVRGPASAVIMVWSEQ